MTHTQHIALARRALAELRHVSVKHTVFNSESLASVRPDLVVTMQKAIDAYDRLSQANLRRNGRRKARRVKDADGRTVLKAVACG